MASSVRTFFSSSGPLALAFSGYQIRQSQVEMSEMIEDVFKTKGFNCIEAETGIGKSFAYLVPSIYKAIHDKQKIVVSTHTIALQEQLFNKDIPFLLDLLGVDIEVVLVKGMNNYLCLEKLTNLSKDPAFFKHPHLVELNSKLSSDLDYESILHTLPRDLSHKLHAESLTCLSHTCPHFKDCHFFKARKPVETASILIVNHHLLLTDMMLKAEGKQEAIIPSCHHLIIDEAHHIPDIAEQLFSHELSQNSLEARLNPKILKEHLYLLTKAFQNYNEDKLSFFCETECHQQIQETIEGLKKSFETASCTLLPNSSYVLLEDPPQELEALFDEGLFNLKDLESSCDIVLKTAKELEIQDKYRTSLFVIEKLKNESRIIQETLEAFLEKKKDKLFFYEKTSYTDYFKCHYIHASKKLAYLFETNFFSTTFCSATLTFDLSFDVFKKACGLSHEKHLISEGKFISDFDYKKAMLFAIPSDMPEPQHPDYESKLASFCHDIIEATEGGVFLLFTSYDQLFKMAEKLKKTNLVNRVNFFIQGTDSKQNLLDGFKSGNNSVLLGTDSFWEGVDVQGEKLRCVIISKLPFRSPSDPIFQATASKLREEKKDPFYEKALPEASIKFKQGLGRLIRSKDDFGVVICTDMRLINKAYGKFFLKTLPNCRKKLAPSLEIIQATKAIMQPVYK